jgi:hypothetical protein
MDRLKMIENRQIVGNRILGELSFGDMGQCESFLNSRKKYGYSQRADGTFGFTSLERLSFEEDDQGIPIPRHVGLQPFLENQFDRLQECFASGLNKFFENSEKEKGFLNLSIAEEKGIEGKVDSKREQIDATLKVLNVSEEIMDSNQSTAGDLDQQLVQNLAKLSAPVSKMAHVKLKSETQINLQEEDTNEIWKLYRDHIKGGSSVWLSSMALESVLKTLTEVLPYDEFMTEDRSQLMPPGVVERSRKKWNTHWDYLELSQKWLKIARLQHHMLTGDVLLPKIERILFKRAVDPQNSSKYLNQNLYSDRSVQYKVVSEALQKNPLLKANLAKWIFSQNLADKSGKDFISSYEYFRDLSQIKNAKNPSLEIESRRQQLKRLAREGLERRGLLSYQDLDIQYVKTDKDQFKLILMNGQFSLDLPSAQELYADSHFLSDEVVRLNSLSQKVFDVKSDYLYQSWAEYKDPKYQSFRELGLVYRGIMGTVLD